MHTFWKPVLWERTRLSSWEVQASMTSKAWRDSGNPPFSPLHSRRQTKAQQTGCSITHSPTHPPINSNRTSNQKYAINNNTKWKYNTMLPHSNFSDHLTLSAAARGVRFSWLMIFLKQSFGNCLTSHWRHGRLSASAALCNAVLASESVNLIVNSLVPPSLLYASCWSKKLRY